MIRVLVVDDEALAIARLQVALDRIDGARIVGTARDARSALRAIDETRPDLVLLDINMPGDDGITLARGLAEREVRPEIAFVTAFDGFAVEAFEVEAVDYLLKPVEFDRLDQTIARAGRRLAQRDATGRADELDRVVVALRREGRESTKLEHGSGPGGRLSGGFWAPAKDSMIRVPFSDIEWIEAARDYVLLRTHLKSYILRATMNDVEAQLDPLWFLRVHRSTIVRRDQVAKVERPGRGALRLVLLDGANLNVGPRHIAAVRTALGL